MRLDVPPDGSSHTLQLASLGMARKPFWDKKRFQGQGNSLGARKTLGERAKKPYWIRGNHSWIKAKLLDKGKTLMEKGKPLGARKHFREMKHFWASKTSWIKGKSSWIKENILRQGNPFGQGILSSFQASCRSATFQGTFPAQAGDRELLNAEFHIDLGHSEPGMGKS